jgi:hypothetical protein
MRHLKQFVAGLALALGVSFTASPVVGDDKDDEEVIDPEELVEALVNPGKPYHVAPRDYDLKAQERIKAAWVKLRCHSDQACPILMKHLDDDRYSISFHISGKNEYPPKTVGHICGVILSGAIESAYRSHTRVGSGGPDTYYHFSYARRVTGNFKDKDWREKFEKKPLIKMQIEAVKWAIQTVNEFEIKDEEKKMDVIKKLREQLKELKRSRVPVIHKSKNMEVYNFPTEFSIKKSIEKK